MERLQKYLAHAGVASRRQCEEIILAGRVKVNGKIVKKLGTKITPDKDRVLLDGKLIQRREQKVYLMINKPRGYLSTVKDDRNRKTVLELLADINERVYPVGRLDYDSEGLLLLTNDGELTYALTHPKHQIRKTYRVRVKGVPDEQKLIRLSDGIQLEDGITAPATVALTHILNDNALLEITIHEGKNRQVRRMCDAIGHPVLRLVRIRIGPLELRKLPTGKMRQLNLTEINAIKKAAGLTGGPTKRRVMAHPKSRHQ